MESYFISFTDHLNNWKINPTLRSTSIWGQLGQVNSKTVFYHQVSPHRWIWSIFSVLQLKKIANPPRPQRQNDIGHPRHLDTSWEAITWYYDTCRHDIMTPSMYDTQVSKCRSNDLQRTNTPGVLISSEWPPREKNSKI